MSEPARKLKAVPPPESEEKMADGQGPEDDVQQTLWDHITDLRQRLIYAAYGLFAAVILCYIFHEELANWVLGPLLSAWRAQAKNPNVKFITPNPTDALFVYIRVAVYAGVFASMPNTLYQFWAFVSPGLYRREKRLVVPFVTVGSVFFVAGGLFCRYFIMPFAFEVMLDPKFTGQQVEPLLSLSDSLDICLMMLMTFGVIFELPLVLTLLAKLGIVGSKTLSKYRRYAIVVNVIVAAIITPTGDPFNLALMAIPLCVFYEFGIIGARLAEATNKGDETDKVAEEET
jgi:sec-independent protein translocase protein TatC